MTGIKLTTVLAALRRDAKSLVQLRGNSEKAATSWLQTPVMFDRGAYRWARKNTSHGHFWGSRATSGAAEAKHDHLLRFPRCRSGWHLFSIFGVQGANQLDRHWLRYAVPQRGASVTPWIPTSRTPRCTGTATGSPVKPPAPSSACSATTSQGKCTRSASPAARSIPCG